MAAEDNLLERAMVGDQAAWVAIVKKYDNSLFAFCKQFIKDVSPIPNEDAENLKQDTWMEFLEYIKNNKITSTVKSLLYKIAQNNCLNFVRRYRVVCDGEEIDIKFYPLDTVTGKVTIRDDETGEIEEFQI